MVIGIYWGVHNRTFRGIRRYDRGLIRCNFIILIFIGFLPFPTSLISSRPNDRAVLALYAATAAAAGLSMFWVWHHAYADGGGKAAILADIIDKAVLREGKLLVHRKSPSDIIRRRVFPF